MKKSTVVIAATLCLALAVPALACSVPVFRYALERWVSDPYELLVYHRGPLTEDQQAVADLLSSDGHAGKVHANVNLTLVDLDADPDPQLVKIWESQETETLPWLVARYPLPTRIPVDAFAGPLTEENVQRLLDSPTRREIARRLLTGDTAVLVLLESGDQEKDEAAFKLVETHAEQMAQTLKLPEIAPEDLDEVSVDPLALKLDFSTIRVARDDPAEKMFVEMLLGSEEDLHDLNEPMAFPVFGRGRVLYALIGGGITTENVQQAGVDLTGPCTCTVKDQNPGVDLVMAVDWDGLVEQEVEIDKALPPLAGLGGFTEDIQPTATTDETTTTDPTTTENPTTSVAILASESVASESPEPAEESLNRLDTRVYSFPELSPLWTNLLMFGGLAVVVIIGASIFLFRKKT
ncbi:hypothetical protein [Symmachiella dynata]|uniref:hypothetical protein n=2 Tax=Symmachiella dynata TaxID=2527995 RepID=UPI00119E395F|nr:hypothetical protein [Symmachiella dynata]